MEHGLGAAFSWRFPALRGAGQLLLPPSSGSIYLDGQETRFADPRDARSRGIATVHQEVGTIPLMSVGRNFFLGAEPTKGRWPFRRIDMKRANEIALEQ